MASTQPTAASASGNGNYTVILNPQTGAFSATLSFPCQPYDPYYPGVGSLYYVDCSIGSPSNGGKNPGVYAVSVATNALVAQILLPGFGANGGGNEVLAWDPVSGLLYACDGSSLLALSFVNSSVVLDHPMPGGCRWVVFDPASNSLLVAGAADPNWSSRLFSVDPATGSIEASILPGYNLTSTVIDPADGWAAVGTLQGDVLLLDDSTFATDATISAGPAGVPQGGTSQLLLDPSHGDLYLLTANSLVAVNESANAVLTAVSIEDTTQSWTSAYAATVDAVLIGGLYGYLEAVEFSHSTTVRLTSVLWLEPTLAFLVLGAAAGALVGVASWSWHRRRAVPP